MPKKQAWHLNKPHSRVRPSTFKSHLPWLGPCWLKLCGCRPTCCSLSSSRTKLQPSTVSGTTCRRRSAACHFCACSTQVFWFASPWVQPLSFCVFLLPCLLLVLRNKHRNCCLLNFSLYAFIWGTRDNAKCDFSLLTASRGGLLKPA